MEIVNNQTNELDGTITIKIKKDDYKENFNKRLKELRKKVSMKGFRPGHVPVQIIKKLYGKEILLEEVNKIVSDALVNFIKENKLKLIGDFIPVEDKTKFDIETQENFEFTFDYSTTSKPFINYDEITTKYYKAQITEDDIDEEIKRIRKNFGEYIESEKVEDKNDIFYVTVIELDENQKVKENGVRKDDIVLSLDLIDPKTHELFIGKKKDDELIIRLSELIPDKKRRASMINVKEQDLDNISDNFKIIITKVKKFKEAELNEELFKKYAPNKEIKDIEQFRNYVKENLEKYFEELSEQIFNKEVKQVLMNTIEIKISEGFLKRWLEYRQKNKPQDQKLSKEDIEKQIPEFLQAIKWNTIIEQIGEDLGVKLERKDAIKVHADMLRLSLSNYGIDLSQFGDDFFMQHAENEYDKLKESDRYQIESAAFEKKIFKALKDKVKLEEQEISVDLLEAKIKGQNKEEEKKQEKTVSKDEDKKETDNNKSTDTTQNNDE